MATQSNNLMLLDASGFPRIIDTTSDDLQIGVVVDFTKDVSVGENLSVAGNLLVDGDIVARSTINLVIQDSFIDLGVGNTTDVKTPAGFSFNIAANFGGTVAAVENITAMTAGVVGAPGTPPKLVPSAATNFAAGDILVLTGSSDGSNDGLYVVESIDGGGDIFLKGVGATSQPASYVPWIRTNVDTLTAQTATAYKADIAIMAVSDNSSFLDADGNAYAEGAFLQAYAADAVESDFSANGAYSSMGAGSTTLQSAYDAPSGNTILTNASGAIEFTLNGTAGRGFSVLGENSGDGTIALGTSGSKVALIDMQATGAIGATTGDEISLSAGTSFSASDAVGGFGLDGSGNFATLDTLSVALNASNLGSISLGNSGETSPINIGTAAARTISVGSAAATKVQVDAIEVDINGGNTGVFVDAGTAGLNLGTSTTAGPDISPINIGTNDGARDIAVGNALSATLSLNALDVDITGASSLDLESVAIKIGNNGDAASVITIGEATQANTISIDAGSSSLTLEAQTDSSLNVSAGTLDIDSSGAMSLNSTAGAINIGNDADAFALNVATAGARVISLGNALATSLSMTSLDTNLSGVNTLDLVSPIISIGSDATDKAINIGGDIAQANTIVIDAGTSSYNINAASNSKLQVDGSDAGELNLVLEVVNSGAGAAFITSTATVVKTDGWHEFGSEAGISAVAGGPISAGRVCVFKNFGGAGKLTHASADAVAEDERALHVTSYMAAVADDVGSYGGVAGTVSNLEFDSAPAATDVGKVVYLLAGTTSGNEGKVTLTAPTGTGVTVFKVGILKSSTAASAGLYPVLLQPAFIAKRP